MLDTGLYGKVAIVTGANHGMGAAIASAFAKQGAKVLIHYYRAGAEAHGELTEEDAQKAAVPGRAYYFKMQTSSPDELVKEIRDVTETFDGISDIKIDCHPIVALSE